MAERFQLISQKHEIRCQIERMRRQLEQERLRESRWGQRRRIRKLEEQLERLMVEEYNLRLAIDRSR